MHILVTGGAGFIGTNFCRYLAENSNVKKITIVDKLTYAGLRENFDPLTKKHKHIEFIHGDICDFSLMRPLVRNINILFNFAAESHVDRSITNPKDFINSNIYGPFTLLECLRQEGKTIRFVQVSTDEVYGSLTSTDSPSVESSLLQPSSPYSASKAAAEHLTLSYFHTYKLDVVITRSSNNYGAHQLPEKFLPVVVLKALRNEKIPVYGDGKNRRDWMHVSDNCRGIWLASQRGRSGEVYNLGSGNELENNQLVKIVLDHLKKPHELAEFVKDRPGHDFRYALNSTKAQEELQWQPEVDVQCGILETINWYKNNQEWVTMALRKLQGGAT